jgi:hypothetical protein
MKTYDSVRRKILYNILTKFGIPMKLVRLIKVCLNKMYSEVQTSKHLSDTAPVQNGMKQEDELSPFPRLYYLATRASFFLCPQKIYYT